MKKILVTGSNGFLGMKLTEKITALKGFQLIATGAGANRYPKPGTCDYADMDITRAEVVNKILDQYEPEVIIHTAAISHVDVCEKDPALAQKINVDATRLLADAAERHNAQFIYLSTDFVFDGEAGPYAETDAPNPQNVYGQTKLESEKIVGKISNAAILRTILVYGKPVDHARSNLILWVKNELENQRTIHVTNDHWRMPTLVEDLAEACLAVINRRARGIFHISSDENLSTYEIACNVARFWHLDQSLIRSVPASFFKQHATRPAKTGFVIDKARQELGFEPKRLSDGLRLISEQIQMEKKRVIK